MGLRVLGPALAAGVVVATAAAAPAALTTVQTRQDAALGRILVNARGLTLYHDAAERRNSVRCTGACARQWPPLLIGAHAKPIAGPGVRAALLGTVKRPDGKLQVTYGGLPLYRFAGDARAGDAKGQGSGGIWHAVAPSGRVVTKAASAPAGAGTTGAGGAGPTTTPGSTGSTGSGTSTSPGTTTTTPGTSTNCAADPGGYGCM